MAREGESADGAGAAAGGGAAARRAAPRVGSSLLYLLFFSTLKTMRGKRSPMFKMLAGLPWAQYARFAVSGFIGTALFRVCYDLLVEACPFQQGCATLSWLVSYFLSIVWQHALHQYIVFGVSADYWSSLLWTYISYSGSLLLSTILNWILVENLHVNHNVAWVVTLLSTGMRLCVCMCVCVPRRISHAAQAPSAICPCGQRPSTKARTRMTTSSPFLSVTAFSTCTCLWMCMPLIPRSLLSRQRFIVFMSVCIATSERIDKFDGNK